MIKYSIKVKLKFIKDYTI